MPKDQMSDGRFTLNKDWLMISGDMYMGEPRRYSATTDDDDVADDADADADRSVLGVGILLLLLLLLL